MKKIISLILSITILLTLFSVNIQAETLVSTAGVKIIATSRENGFITFAVQMILPPNSNGATTASTVLSYDNTDLELMDVTGDTSYPASSAYIASVSTAIDVNLTDTTGDDYFVADAASYTEAGQTRTALVVNIVAWWGDPVQSGTLWTRMYTLRFKEVVGGEITADSIRFADATDSTIVTGLTDKNHAASWGAEIHANTAGGIYNYSPLEGQDTTTHFIMSHAQNGTTTIEVSDVVKGDVTGEGKVTNADVVRIRTNISTLGRYEFTAEQIEAADINDDGKVTNADLVHIRTNISTLGRYPLQ